MPWLLGPTTLAAVAVPVTVPEVGQVGTPGSVAGAGNGGGLTQPDHDAAALLGQPKVNMRLRSLDIQIVVSNGIAEGGAIRTEGGMKGAGGLGCNRARCFVDAAQGGIESVCIVIEAAVATLMQSTIKTRNASFFMFEFLLLTGTFEN